MEVAVEIRAPLERRMDVEVPEERISQEIDSRLRNMKTSARLPGFRPGKVPMKIITKRFGPQVREEVIGELIRSSFLDAVAQRNLRPAGGPKIDPITATPGQGVRYTAVFEIYPEITLNALEELAINRLQATVEEADIERMIGVLQDQHREWSDVTREATNGDRITVDFLGKIDGKEFAGGKAEGLELELGKRGFIDGFSEGLVGTLAGTSRALNLQFPEEYPEETLAGKPVEFDVCVQKVQEGLRPAIDEEFIKKFGVEDGTAESFREEVRRNMERELENTIKAMTKERVFSALIEHNPIEIPQALMEGETQRMVERHQNELRMRGLDPARFPIEPSPLSDEAKRRVHLSLLLIEFIKTNELRPDSVQVRAEVERIAVSYEEPHQVINWFYAEPGRLEEIESRVVEDAAVELIIQRAQVTDEESSFDALMNPNSESEDLANNTP